MLAYNPKTTKYRFVVCNIYGNDDKTRTIDLLGPIFASQPSYFVQHVNKAPLFHFNAEGTALNIDPQTDHVLIGFQGTVWWKLKEGTPGEWRQDILNTDGSDISLFYNSKTKEQIISLSSVYGDEILDALEALYNKGARHFVLLGTGGGLDGKLNVGDILLPARYQQTDGSWTTFANAAEKLNLSLNAPQKILHGESQGWVPDLEAETKPYIGKLRDSGVQAIDIESKYFAQFAIAHPDVEAIAVISVSDLPLGALTYDQENAVRDIPMESITAVFPQILAGASRKAASIMPAKPYVVKFSKPTK
jgi:hypothetical protein